MKKMENTEEKVMHAEHFLAFAGRKELIALSANN